MADHIVSTVIDVMKIIALISVVVRNIKILTSVGWCTGKYHYLQYQLIPATVNVTGFGKNLPSTHNFIYL